MGSTAQPPARRGVALTCTTLALLVLLAGSSGMVAFLLRFGRSNTVPESAFSALLLWPLVMVLVMALGGLGLWAAHRPRAIWGLVAASVVVLIVPLARAGTAANAIGQQLPAVGPAPQHLDAPYSGGAAVAIIALFVLINGVALYAAWRFVLRVSLDRRGKQEP